MPKVNVCDLVTKLTEPAIVENNIELVDVEFVKEGTNYYLRLFIDKDGGIGLDDCEKISTIVSDLLDKEDPIQQAYFLEVSSPGLERPLKKAKDFLKYEGHRVIVKTFSAFEGKKKHQGKLGIYNDTNLHLLVESKELMIPWEIVSQVKPDWEE